MSNQMTSRNKFNTSIIYLMKYIKISLLVYTKIVTQKALLIYSKSTYFISPKYPFLLVFKVSRAKTQTNVLSPQKHAFSENLPYRLGQSSCQI